MDRIVLIGGSGSWGGVVVHIWGGRGGGVMQKKESPEFRFPQVDISARERETFEFQAL